MDKHKPRTVEDENRQRLAQILDWQRRTDRRRILDLVIGLPALAMLIGCSFAVSHEAIQKVLGGVGIVAGMLISLLVQLWPRPRTRPLEDFEK